MSCKILIGDMRERLKELPDNSVDSVVCDPPYHLTQIGRSLQLAKNGDGTDRTQQRNYKERGFMGQQWDGGDVAFQPDTWAEVLRVLKPGGHLLAFSGTRTVHRMVCAIEDAGFEIRDSIAWIYGSGFPKSHCVSKGIDRMAGAEREVVGERRLTGTARIKGGGGYTVESAAGNYADAEMSSVLPITAPATDAARQWEGWGSSLKPALEPICLARKPLSEKSIAANVLRWGTGAINVDGCRVEASAPDLVEMSKRSGIRTGGLVLTSMPKTSWEPTHQGRWPANLIHDGSDEVLAGFPDSAGQLYGTGPEHRPKEGTAVFGDYGPRPVSEPRGDSGSAARFFYTAKADQAERHAGCGDKGNNHPTVKPVSLMQWLVRLVTPPGGTVLDPFAGSGSTLIAADAEQFNCIGIELSPEYAAIAEARLRQSAGLFAQVKVA